MKIAYADPPYIGCAHLYGDHRGGWQCAGSAGNRVTVVRIGEAEREEGAEGKIKQTGTLSGRFVELFLSAHWLGLPRAAPYFWMPRAAILHKASALLGFDRHHARRTPDISAFRSDART